MSLAGGADTNTNNAVNYLVTTSNVAVVSAAGNNAGDACALSPASAADSLTVAATATDDTLAYFSNYGSCTKLAGPGENILSAWIGSNTATNTLSGTSMITPLTCGVVALDLQRVGLGSLNAAQSQANVVAMATANWVSTPSGTLPLLFSSEGAAPAPQPPPPPPGTPPGPPPHLNGGPPRRALGNQNGTERGLTGLAVCWSYVLLLSVHWM